MVLRKGVKTDEIVSIKYRKSVFGTEDRQRRHNPHMVGNLEKKSIEMEYNKYLQV